MKHRACVIANRRLRNGKWGLRRMTLARVPARMKSGRPFFCPDPILLLANAGKSLATRQGFPRYQRLRAVTATSQPTHSHRGTIRKVVYFGECNTRIGLSSSPDQVVAVVDVRSQHASPSMVPQLLSQISMKQAATKQFS
jgi:hypothetical protein